MDLRRLKDEANRLFAKGKLQRAFELYWKLIDAEPQDPALRLRHAEVCRRLGLDGRAIASYRAAAELFSNMGHLSRAAAAARLALELAPSDRALLRAVRGFDKKRKEAAPSPPSPRALSPSPAPKPRALSLEASPVRAGKKKTPRATSSGVSSGGQHYHVIHPEEAPAGERTVIVDAFDLGADELVQSDVPWVEAEELPAPRQPEIRRISSHEIAVRASPGSGWIILSSAAGIDVRFSDTLASKDVARIRRTFSGELLSEEEFRRLFAQGARH